MLTKKIGDLGENAVVLSIDDFFSDRLEVKTVDDEAPDYDSVKALDLAYLGDFTRDLLLGKDVRIPKYSFLDTARVGYTDFSPRPEDIYVYEGIQAVYPEVTSLFTCDYKSIFICVMDDIEYRGVTLTRDDIRLTRRLVRDYKFRGASAEFTLHLWENVRANEDNNIYPNATNCDVYINSFLPYELFVISKYAREVLSTVPSDSKYRDEADELIKKLSVFECEYIDEDMVPVDSVYREFIGH